MRVCTAWLTSLLDALFVAAVAISFSGCDGAPSGDLTKSTERPATTETVDTALDASAAAPKPKLKPGTKTVALEKAGDRSYDKTFDDIRFDIKPGDPFKREMLPNSIEELAGKKIRIRGFILPTPQKRGIKQFVLVRDNQECCFGPGAALYDCILVEMQDGKTTEFSIPPVAVVGTFDIQEFKGPDGVHLAIYHLAAESVK